jgi:hypothetical protein
MHKRLVCLMAAAATLSLASQASAQICAGNPNGALGLFVGGRAATSDGEQRFGVEGGVRIPGGLGVAAGIDRYTEGDDVDEYFGRVALETTSLGLIIGPKVSACPTVEVRHASIEDVGSLTTIPVGIGIGAGLSTLVGPSIQGYVIPELVFSRASFDDSALDDETDTNFGFRGGAMLGFGTFFLGGEIEHVFSDGAEPAFGVRAGFRL